MNIFYCSPTAWTNDTSPKILMKIEEKAIRTSTLPPFEILVSFTIVVGHSIVSVRHLMQVTLI